MRATDGTQPSPATLAGRQDARGRALDVDARRVAGPAKPKPFCRVQTFDEEWWPVGTLWLNTSGDYDPEVYGPRPTNGYPLLVKRAGDPTWWDHVAWLVPAN